MDLGSALYLPYQLVRQPFVAVDRYAVSRLSPDNPVRGAYEGALGLADAMMARVLDELRPGGTGAPPEPAQPQSAHPEPASEPAAEPVSAADEQRREAFAHKADDAVRGNHSPAAMQRDLARMQAVVEARESQEPG
jgi:hypothetical protein